MVENGPEADPYRSASREGTARFPFACDRRTALDRPAAAGDQHCRLMKDPSLAELKQAQEEDELKLQRIHELDALAFLYDYDGVEAKSSPGQVSPESRSIHPR